MKGKIILASMLFTLSALAAMYNNGEKIPEVDTSLFMLKEGGGLLTGPISTPFIITNGGCYAIFSDDGSLTLYSTIDLHIESPANINLDSPSIIADGLLLKTRIAQSNYTWSSIGAGEQVTQLCTVGGAKVGDSVNASPATLQDGALTWQVYIFATNTVTLIMKNQNLLSAVDPSNGNWRIEVRSY